MRFTLIMFGGAILLMLLDSLDGDLSVVGGIGAVWFYSCFPLVGAYWIARVVRMAWRHGARRADPGAI